ncbi:MAG: GC-type dockerin domain-anchored protein [Phycisphaerales bacterium]
MLLLTAAAGLPVLCASQAFAQTDPLTRPFPKALELDTLDGQIGFRVAGERSEDRLGQSVASVGDINGDGIGDLIIGASRADAGGVTLAGSAYVIFGRSAAAGGFPAAPSLADLDGTNGFRIDGVTEFGNLGTSVAGAGDVNGDGIDDVIIGTPNDRPGGRIWAGSAYVIYGRDAGAGEPFPAAMTPADLDGVSGFRVDGTTDFDFAGTSVSAAGDLNGDGIDDVVISAFRASPGGRFEAGATYVLFGRRSSSGAAFPAEVRLSDLDGTTGFRLDGERETDQSGSWVAPAGDLNHDGLDDIAIGAWRASPGGRPEAGSTYVIHGRDSGAGETFAPVIQLADLDGIDGFRLDGAVAFDLSGRSVDGAGGLNNGGIDDQIVGAPVASPDRRTETGSSYVLYGQDASVSGPFPPAIRLDTLDGTTGFRIDGIDPGDFAGWTVAGAGDVNSDGLDDVIIGAVTADPGGDEWAGESYVVYGRDGASGAGFPAIVRLSDLEQSTGFQLNGTGEFTQSAAALASAGDVNGDGRDDMIIAAPRADGGGLDASGECSIVYGRDPVACAPDLNGDGSLDVADFLAFQNFFDARDPAADFDGDGRFTLFDFLGFQNAFDAGCP